MAHTGKGKWSTRMNPSPPSVCVCVYICNPENVGVWMRNRRQLWAAHTLIHTLTPTKVWSSNNNNNTRRRSSKRSSSQGGWQWRWWRCGGGGWGGLGLGWWWWWWWWSQWQWWWCWQWVWVPTGTLCTLHATWAKAASGSTIVARMLIILPTCSSTLPPPGDCIALHCPLSLSPIIPTLPKSPIYLLNSITLYQSKTGIIWAMGCCCCGGSAGGGGMVTKCSLCCWQYCIHVQNQFNVPSYWWPYGPP